MADMYDFNKERMGRMSSNEQFQHIEGLLDKLNGFSISLATKMMSHFEAKVDQEGAVMWITHHLNMVGFMSAAECAPYNAHELIALVHKHQVRYDSCLYRHLQKVAPGHPDLKALCPLKPIE